MSRPRKQKIPGGIGPSGAFGTQSATGKRGVYFCKNPLLKTPLSWLLTCISRKHPSGDAIFFRSKSGPKTHPKMIISHDVPDPGRKCIPPPCRPHFWPKGIFQRRGVGVYMFGGPAAGILYAPPFIIPPPPREGCFQGCGGWGCIKFGPILEPLKKHFWHHVM